MRRFIMYDNLGKQLGEVSANDIFALERREEINGEHCLEITTTQVLAKNTRIIYQDGRGIWREYVVAGVDEEHASGNTVIGTYYCVWSLQADLLGVTVSVMPGVQNPVTAGAALTALLSTQSRWTAGTVTNTNTGGASMYDMSAWKALGVLVENWGGELSATIAVDNNGVVSRAVNLYSKLGEQTAKRRYDFGADVRSVKRKHDDAPLYCRISPRGKGEETEGGGYGRKITIESVNDGKDYLEYAPMVDVAKIANGSSGWIYPTVIVENGDIETPLELKTWAETILEETCTPKITYEIDAIQAAIEGVDVQGVSLGDAVQVVDRQFGEGVRVTGRVVSTVVDELNERRESVKFGYIEDNLGAQFSDGRRALESVNALSDSLSTAAYVNDLLDRLNVEINATGGYTYIVPGNGILTFDVAVADPLNPVEASQVVEAKGGSIRIANSKTAQGEWEWRSVFTSGHIAADMVTAAQLTAGYIGNATNGSYWDLDNDILRIGSTSTVGGEAVTELLASTHDNNLVRNGDFADGVEFWNKPTGAAVVDDATFGKCMCITGTNSSYIYTYSTTNFKHEANNTYTIGFYAKADAECALNVGVNGYSSAPSRYLNGVTLGTEWTYFTGTLSTGSRTGALRFEATQTGVNVYIAKVMLSEGSYVSEFELSQRDIVYRVEKAGATATNYLTFDSTNGLDVGYTGTQAKTRISGSGVEIFDNSGASVILAKVVNTRATVRVGRETGSGNVVMASTGSVDINAESTNLAHFGYGSGNDASKTITIAPYYTIGTRRSSLSNMIGNYSFAAGFDNDASQAYSIALGNGNIVESFGAAIGVDNHTSGIHTFAFGYKNTVSFQDSIAIGQSNSNGGDDCILIGESLQAISSSLSQIVLGRKNLGSSSARSLIFGIGDQSRANGMIVNGGGDLWIAGTFSQNSDRRLKEHIKYLDDDACEFVRKLKPALFVKDGKRHLGFYAQDVDEADTWDTSTVASEHSNEALDFDPLTLDYTALIAPLVAYTHQLESRIEELERKVNAQ